MAEGNPSGPSGPGPGVDAQGRPVIDPTANVIAILEAAVKRQDDLREAESRHVREIAVLRAEFTSELRRAESERIDAIRAVDVGAVQRAAEVAAAQAEALRNQVAATAQASQTQLAAALDPINARLADLTRAQYEAQGQKTQVVENRGANVALIAAVSLAVALVLAIVTIVGFILANTGN